MIINVTELQEAYLHKKKHAENLDEAFLLDYETFATAWTHKARWLFRKRGWHGLVMTKIDHSLPYSNTNIMITTRFNSKAQAKHLGMKKGDTHTDEAKKKISEALTGVKKSDKHKAKISATMTGRERGPYKKKIDRQR